MYNINLLSKYMFLLEKDLFSNTQATDDLIKVTNNITKNMEKIELRLNDIEKKINKKILSNKPNKEPKVDQDKIKLEVRKELDEQINATLKENEEAVAHIKNLENDRNQIFLKYSDLEKKHNKLTSEYLKLKEDKELYDFINENSKIIIEGEIDEKNNELIDDEDNT